MPINSPVNGHYLDLELLNTNLSNKVVFTLLVAAFSVGLHIAYQIQPQMGFGFPKPTSECLYNVSVFLLGNLPCSHLRYPFFLWLSLVRSNIFLL